MGFFSLICCGGCCLIFSLTGVFFLLLFAAMVAAKNVSFEEMWEENFQDPHKARTERVRCCDPTHLRCLHGIACIFDAFVDLSALCLSLARCSSSLPLLQTLQPHAPPPTSDNWPVGRSGHLHRPRCYLDYLYLRRQAAGQAKGRVSGASVPSSGPPAVVSRTRSSPRPRPTRSYRTRSRA